MIRSQITSNIRANISNQFGLVGVASNLLLDEYPGATVAYALTKLRSAYSGSAIRVRRSSDNSEQDIGFSGNDLYESALTTFCGAGDGFVVTWYDQSGNGSNFTQATATNQPQIVSSGSVITLNSDPSINADGTSDYMQSANGVLGSCSNLTIFIKGAFNETGQANDLFLAASNGSYGSDWFTIRQSSGGLNSASVFKTTQKNVFNGTANTSQHKFYFNFKASTRLALGVDGSNQTEVSTIPSTINLTAEIDLFCLDNGGSIIANGAVKAQTIIIYKTDQSSNQSAIEALL